MENKKPAKSKSAAKSTTPKPVSKKPAAAPEAASVPAQTQQTQVAQPAPVNQPAPVKSSTPVTTPGPTGPHSAEDGRRTWIVIGSTVAALVVAFLIVFGVLIYKYHSDSRMVQIVAAAVPYPAERVNGHYVSYSDYLFEANSIKHYYLSQTDSSGKPAVNFTTTEGKQKLRQLHSQVLVQLQQDSIVREMARKNKLRVTDKEVDAQVDQITKSAGGEEKVKDVLKKFYGWDVNDLKKKIRFQLLQQKVGNKVQSDPAVDAQAKSKANDVYKQIKGGGDFAVLAKKYSQDSSAANGGDLGFFGKGQMVKAFEQKAFSQQPGDVSTPVKTQYGYHIIKTVEFNADHTQAHAAHILIKTIDFAHYLQKQQKAAKVNQYIHP